MSLNTSTLDALLRSYPNAVVHILEDCSVVVRISHHSRRVVGRYAVTRPGELAEYCDHMGYSYVVW